MKTLMTLALLVSPVTRHLAGRYGERKEGTGQLEARGRLKQL